MKSAKTTRKRLTDSNITWDYFLDKAYNESGDSSKYRRRIFVVGDVSKAQPLPIPPLLPAGREEDFFVGVASDFFFVPEDAAIDGPTSSRLYKTSDTSRGDACVEVISCGDLHFKSALDVYLTAEWISSSTCAIILDLAKPHAVMLTLERWLKALNDRKSDIKAEAESSQDEASSYEEAKSAHAQITVVCINRDSNLDKHHSDESFGDAEELRLFVQLRIRRFCLDHGCSLFFMNRSVLSFNPGSIEIADTNMPEEDAEGSICSRVSSPQLLLCYLLHCLYPDRQFFTTETLQAASAEQPPSEPFLPRGFDTEDLLDQDFKSGIADHKRMAWDVPFENLVNLPDTSTGGIDNEEDEAGSFFELSLALDEQAWLANLKKDIVEIDIVDEKTAKELESDENKKIEQPNANEFFTSFLKKGNNNS